MKIKVTKKPWGEEHLFAISKNYAGKMIIIKKGHRLSLQYHKKKEETFFVLEGMIRLLIGTNRKKLVEKIFKPGQAIHIPPKTIHRTEAVKDCRMIEVSSPELTDIVRIEDDYNRIKE